MSTFTSTLLIGLAGLVLSASGGLAGCAAPSSDDEGVADESDDLSAAGKALIGAYKDDSGAFKTFELTSKSVGQRNRFVAVVDTGIRCMVAPCPSSERIEGTFTAGSKSITLYAPTASAHAKHLLGKYSYLAQGSKFSLMREGFAQSLEKVGAIWPDDATKLVAKITGGFMPPPPAGSTCSGGAEYTLDRAARKLSWKNCDFNGSLPRHFTTGVVTLSTAKLATIDAAMNALEVATEDRCGADKPYETLKVSTPAGDKTYTDSFYSCQRGDTVYVDNIGGVFGALSDAAGN